MVLRAQAHGFRSMGAGFRGAIHAAAGEPENRASFTGIAVRWRWWTAVPVIAAPVIVAPVTVAQSLWPRSSSHHRLEEFGRPARLRFLRRGTPFSPCAGAALRFGPLGFLREPHGASRSQVLMSFGAVLEGPSGPSGGGLLVGASPRGPPRPGKALQARAVGPAFPPAPEAGAEGLGCWFVRTRRAGTRSRKGPPVLLRPAPYRQVWRHCRRGLGGSPARVSRAESATAHEASGRALPRVRSSGHPPPAPGASFCCGIGFGH
jgi:hypothetical protein